MIHLFRGRMMWIWLIAAIFSLETPSLGDDAPAKTPVAKEDKQVLRQTTDKVWYDSERGELTKISANYDQGKIDASDRHKSIAVPDSSQPTSGSSTFGADFYKFLQMLFGSWQIILIICILALIGIAVFLILKQANYFAVPSKRSKIVVGRARSASISQLPFELQQTQLGLLGQADYYRRQGDYSNAIIYLFSHVLVEMDHARCIRLERGKTNGSYLREIQERDRIRSFARQTVAAFEFVFFGKHQLSQEAFEKIWQQLPSFDSYLKSLHSSGPEGRSAPISRSVT